jgi:hypothetical protein
MLLHKKLALLIKLYVCRVLEFGAYASAGENWLTSYLGDFRRVEDTVKLHFFSRASSRSASTSIFMNQLQSTFGCMKSHDATAKTPPRQNRVLKLGV